jgi:hypothetical protein
VTNLGYPVYLFAILHTYKLLSAIAPCLSRLKEGPMQESCSSFQAPWQHPPLAGAPAVIDHRSYGHEREVCERGMLSATTQAAPASAKVKRNSPQLERSLGFVATAGIQTSSVKTLNITASIVAARRG